MSENIEIKPYDDHWPQLFLQEKARLEAILDSTSVVGPIEHVGSTSVVGLAAKPIIDIMVGVSSLAQAMPLIDILTRNGYCYYPYKKDVMHWFCRPSPEIRTHHLHLVPYKSELWRERIQFRDLLRTNSEIRAGYQALKYQLADKYSGDRERYTREKWPFIAQALSGKN